MDEKGVRMKHLLVPWVALTAVVFAALACAGNDGAGTTSNRSDDEDFELAPASQQVYRLRLQGEQKTIDPHLVNFASETTIVKPLFSGLFTYDEDLKVVPNVAAELPTTDNG